MSFKISKGDSRPTIRRLMAITKRLRQNLFLPSTQKLAAELECSYKTIGRDIDLLRDFMGYQLEWNSHAFQYRLAAPLPKAVL
jgi:predicted DNA-binding transcriptional regulator YafY